jgi:hypothetical protein
MALYAINQCIVPHLKVAVFFVQLVAKSKKKLQMKFI